MGLQRVGHDWVIELNWTELFLPIFSVIERIKLDNVYKVLGTQSVIQTKSLINSSKHPNAADTDSGWICFSESESVFVFQKYVLHFKSQFIATFMIDSSMFQF